MLNLILELLFGDKSTGALIEERPDYRNVQLGAFQKPIDVPDKYVTSISYRCKDQGRQQSCVTHAISELITYYYNKRGTLVDLSPRYAYKICKLLDGIPDNKGTYPRVAALEAMRYSYVTETTLKNDTDLSEEEYIGFDITKSMLEEGKKYTLPGFAFVNEDIESIKQAIYQNDLVVGTLKCGTWNSLPVKPGMFSGYHYVLWYGYEKLPNGDYKIFFKNSWGNSWLSRVKKWALPGHGYFLWSDYKDNVYDIIAFTDIPKDLLDNVKNMPYKFTEELFKGKTHPQVIELQKMLNQSPETLVALEGLGSSGNETSYFGSITEAALKKWQQKNGLPATGYFGQMSIKVANKDVPKRTLIEAMILVESGGDDNAVGDKNLKDHAYGCLQIRQPLVTDVNKYLGTQYKSQDCLGNRELSVKIFNTYFKMHPQLVTDEDKAKAWNGGAGWKLLYGKKGYERYTSNLDIYWSKVKKLLNN